MMTDNFRRALISADAGTLYQATFVDRFGDDITTLTQETVTYPRLSYIVDILGVTLDTYDTDASTTNNYYRRSVFAFGTGTKPAESSDYALDSMLDNNDNNFTVVSVTKTNATNLGKNNRIVLSGTFIYKGGEDIEISEVGLFNTIFQRHKSAMFAREVLESPIKVSQNDTFQVSMVIG